MIRKNNYYQPILGVDGKNKFSWEIMEKISKVLKPEFEINMDPKKEIEVVEEEPKKNTNTNGLQKLWKYKLSDLHEIAEKLGIEVKIGNKNKKKEDLYEEIKSKM